MIEKINSREPSQTEKNEQLLASSELGALLVDAYRTATQIDSRVEDVEIVPFEDDSNRVAFARPSWHPEAGGKNKVFVRLGNLDEALERTQHVLDNVPGARELFAKKLFDMNPDDLTPQLLHVFSMLHEIGHTLEYKDHESNPEALIKRNKQEKEALPIGRATVLALIDQKAFAHQFVTANWEKVTQVTGVASLEELAEKQHVAYRNTSSESYADNFALDVLAMNPQLIDQLTSPDLDYYRKYPAAV